MREIKFKAWDDKNKIMLNTDTPNLLIHFNGEINSFGKNGEINGVYFTNQVKLLQYTGLKDKNGKEIYEGDILLLEKGTKRTVLSVPGGFAIESLDDDLNKYGKEIFVPIEGLSDEQNASFIKSTKVIGNIYENPELLEGEEC
ncbi:YopX family protein [Clostridium cadaveris]|uniref:YopX family protein n=1 Tax=Clostridium cadaveris TaxID=1529 RepID=UPI0015B50748|nr:hypothetical protein [Clostridium cadaveris]